MHLTSVMIISTMICWGDWKFHHYNKRHSVSFTATNPITSFQITDHPQDIAALRYTPNANVIRLNENSNYRITASLNSLPRSTITIQATIANEQETAETYVSVACKSNFEFLRRGNLHCSRSTIQLRFEQSIYFTIQVASRDKP